VNRPLQYCTQPGCSVLVPRGRCRTHAVQQDHARRNFDVRKWYDTTRWQRLRLRVLVDQAYACAQCGQVQLRLEVDHIVKHDGNAARFWNRENLQALCTPCHTRKTTRGE
jgi:5-methylcytosine-specific restriction protein A